MFEILRKYLNERAKFSPEEINLITDVCVPKKIRKRQYVLQEGDVCHSLIFVCKGCLRTYRVDDRGIEHVISFSTENWWTGDRESLLSGNPSYFNIDALENSEIFAIHVTKLKKLCATIPVFSELINQEIINSLIQSQHRILAMISYNAEEKYVDFVGKFPDLTVRIPQHMIASYLGITAETLSRVRRESIRSNSLTGRL